MFRLSFLLICAFKLIHYSYSVFSSYIYLLPYRRLSILQLIFKTDTMQKFSNVIDTFTFSTSSVNTTIKLSTFM